MTRREQVKKAIRRQGPDYVPLFIFDGDRSDSDLIQIDVERFYLGPDKNVSEWGFTWASTDTRIPMGTPENPPIADWDDFERYRRSGKPDPADPWYTAWNVFQDRLGHFDGNLFYFLQIAIVAHS